MHRDRETLYLDYINLHNIDQYVTQEGMSCIDALTVEVVHLQAESLQGLRFVQVDEKLKDKFTKLIDNLELALREFNNSK